MKRRVFALGETLLDIIFKNEQPVKAVTGGSMVNASISLGRAGININLLSEFGNDPLGGIIASFLEKNNVYHAWSYRYRTNKTSIAIAMLDDKEEASYTFYHDIPENLPAISLPAFTPDDILLFGSSYSLREERRSGLLRLITEINNAGAFTIYDPNIRKAHHGNEEEQIDLIIENFGLATLVKGSDDDFLNIFGTREPMEIYSRIKHHCPYLYITRGSQDLILITPEAMVSYKIPVIKPVSTIGAGDNFNAGLIYGLIAENVSKTNISSVTRQSWDIISNYGLEFAKSACLSIENYVPTDFMDRLNATRGPND
jgi:fructokinase